MYTFFIKLIQILAAFISNMLSFITNMFIGYVFSYKKRILAWIWAKIAQIYEKLCPTNKLVNFYLNLFIFL